MKFHVKTYGCQMNARDSEAVAVLLEDHGHERASGETDADVVIVNTCSVREKAETKALGKLGLLAAGKREFPGRLVGATGCMVQRMKGDIFAKVRGLDFALGTRRLSKLPEVLESVALGEGTVLDAGENGEAAADLHGHATGATCAFVNVLYGCDRGCTYCIVPAVRGRERSRPAAEIVEEVGELVAGGVREVTLLGQSVMSYGRSNGDCFADPVSPRGFREPFPRLLEAVSGVDGLQRIRFTSGHPSGCTEELARAMLELEPVCENLHLPLQSGSDRILGAMRRGYGTGEYRDAVSTIRAAVPSVAVTTDIIVGFPSETLEEFDMTRRFMAEIGFDNAFIFKYSPREGTPAAVMDDDVAAEEKMRRNKLLLAEQDARSIAANRELVGTVVEVLAEGTSMRNPATWSGRTRTNKIAVFDPPGGLKAGDIIEVAVRRTTAQTLYGDVRE